MESQDTNLPDNKTGLLAHPLLRGSNLNKIIIAVLVAALILGIGTGYLLAGKRGGSSSSLAGNTDSGSTPPKTAQQDSKTFRDFAEGVIQAKPTPSEGVDYSEGTHLLVRTGATPVALTSSVVDLSKYIGKKVKVYGETQKALKAGWLMDVGKVEEVQ